MNPEQVEKIDNTSMDILEEVGPLVRLTISCMPPVVRTVWERLG